MHRLMQKNAASVLPSELLASFPPQKKAKPKRTYEEADCEGDFILANRRVASLCQFILA